MLKEIKTFLIRGTSNERHKQKSWKLKQRKTFTSSFKTRHRDEPQSNSAATQYIHLHMQSELEASRTQTMLFYKRNKQ